MLQDGTAGTDVDSQVSALGSTPYLEGIRRGGERHCDRGKPQRLAVDENLSPRGRRLNRDRAGWRDGRPSLIFPNGGGRRGGTKQDHADPFQRGDDTAPVARHATLGRPRHCLRDRIRNQRQALRFRLRAECLEAVRQGIRESNVLTGRRRRRASGTWPKSGNSDDCHSFLMPPGRFGPDGPFGPVILNREVALNRKVACAIACRIGTPDETITIR